jgi:cytochrome c553
MALSFRHIFLFTLLLPVTGAGGVAPAADVGAIIFQNVCMACHGAKGEGKEELKAPSIAALPTWYTIAQIKNFTEGRRGAHDPYGALMTAIAKTLSTEQIQAVTSYVESLPLVVPAKLVIEGANVQEGQQLYYERCMECHRYNASGEIAFGSPPLIGLQGWYMVDQLKKYKQGHRGATKGDVNGAKMLQLMTGVETEQTMKDLAGYILTLNPAPAAKDDLFKKGNSASERPTAK